MKVRYRKIVCDECGQVLSIPYNAYIPEKGTLKVISENGSEITIKNGYFYCEKCKYTK